MLHFRSLHFLKIHTCQPIKSYHEQMVARNYIPRSSRNFFAPIWFTAFRSILLTILLTFESLGVQIKIACIGDSITEGGNLSSPAIESYPGRLQRLLGTNDYDVRNFGVSGRTLLRASAYTYWREAAFTNSQAFGPDIVIIQLGTNDSKPENWVYGSNFVSDYKEMIGIYASLPSAPRIYLCTPCPVFGNSNPHVNAGVIATNIVPAIRELASEVSLPLIDLHARMTNSAWFPDTIHPNTEGMAAMSAVIFESLFQGSLAEHPEVRMEFPEANTVVLWWPANAAGLVAYTTRTLDPPNWTVLPAIPYKNGEFIHQTNTLTARPERFFQLRSP